MDHVNIFSSNTMILTLKNVTSFFNIVLLGTYIYYIMSIVIYNFDPPYKRYCVVLYFGLVYHKTVGVHIAHKQMSA